MLEDSASTRDSMRLQKGEKMKHTILCLLFIACLAMSAFAQPSAAQIKKLFTIPGAVSVVAIYTKKGNGNTAPNEHGEQTFRIRI